MLAEFGEKKIDDPIAELGFTWLQVQRWMVQTIVEYMTSISVLLVLIKL
jgi:hypothetical protein